MAEPAFPDKRAVRRSFDRAAASGSYDRHSILQDEVGTRLGSHLDPIRIEPTTLLDLGCGTGAFLEDLQRRYPRADVVALDLAPEMLRRAAARTPWWKKAANLRRPRFVCGDAECLPLATGSVQLAFSNLALQWCRPHLAFAEASRVLAAGGLFIFSTFGPDTLRELRSAFAAADGEAHVNDFIDMHDLGDALVHAGLAEPVMEMEMITLEYDTVEAVARDLKAIGAVNALPDRPRGLAGRGLWKRVAERYEALRRDGSLPASYEVIYGHAWKVAPKRIADGRQVIGFTPRTYGR